ncbi:MAG: ATP-dependent DNA helicase RecG [Phycisphaerales bacterium]|nr:ATP-dependent DNA helicase RecG [Phycisphaerales bacterium]
MSEKPPITFSTPVEYAKGVGPVRAAEFRALGVQTCGDLLFHFPRDYLLYADESAIATMREGEVATVRGTILQTRLIPRKPRRFEALIQDASPPTSNAVTPQRCVLTWFNAYGLEHQLQPGMLIRVTGKVTSFNNRKQIVQPKFEILQGNEEERKSARVEPVYPATVELSSAAIMRVIHGILDTLLPAIAEFFPEDFLRDRHFFTRQEALQKIHRPATLQDAATARRTLAYHEFFLHQAAVAIKRYHQRNSIPAIPLRVDDAVDQRIRALLPFSLTKAQNTVIASIRKDLAATKPMNRLLQGDVGSGKTVVALYAMLAASATQSPRAITLDDPSRDREGATGTVPALPHGRSLTVAARIDSPCFHQAALMAPTEILAEQHFVTMSQLLEGKKVKIALLTGSVTGKERTDTLARIADGRAGLVIGTHALLAEAVQFKSLAMIVIDEQHKFGVEQRSQIRTKPSQNSEGGAAPHILVMTATPIPRTLAMTTFGDLDVSVIDELPPGRRGIFTKMTPTSNREEVYKWVATRLKTGEQAYVVVPAIDESELDLRTVSGVQEELQKVWLKNFRVGLIHGRMNRDTRQHIMERFRQHLIDVLVATTVIEVGVDVPNATMMIIEHADRFGLSQLHQLRGRVGRGDKQSYCVLLADQSTDDAIARLQAMVHHASGFKIAEEDLKIRGMGQLIGTAQSGRTDLHFAELLFDPHLLPMSRRDAFNLIASDPRLLDPAHTNLRTEILQNFADTITLADVG